MSERTHDAAQAVSPEFRLEITTAPADIDELEHVSNIAYVRFIQQVAAAHSAAVGLTLPYYQAHGAVFVVRKHEIEYLLPAPLGERLTLLTYVASFRGAGSERRTRILRTSDGAELVRATTLWVYVATHTGRPRRIPAEVAEAFGRDVMGERR